MASVKLSRNRHRVGCFAVAACERGDWTSPWAPVPPAIVRRDAAGRRSKHARHTWLAFPCNDPGCYAQVLVRADAVTDLAEQELEATNGE